MELLESSVVRPRQARYQAALRPDNWYVCDSTVLPGMIPSYHNDECARTVPNSCRFIYCAQNWCALNC